MVLVLSDRADAGALTRRSPGGAIASVTLRDPADADEWLAALERTGVDLWCSPDTSSWCRPRSSTRYRGRIVNVHPALLPAFGGRGMYGRRVHEAVLASGARESGATVHLVDEVYDRGAILAQARVPVLPGDDPETLAARVLEAEHRLLPAVGARRGRGRTSRPHSRIRGVHP